MNSKILLNMIKNIKGNLSYVPACAVDTETNKYICDAYNEAADLEDYIKKAEGIND
jgi:hypothetical protein